jgi:hypothetical protein
MNGWWIGASDSKPACFFEDTTLLNHWLPDYKNIITEQDVTLTDMVIITHFVIFISYIPNLKVVSK